MNPTIRISFTLLLAITCVIQSQAQMVIYSQPNDEPDGFCSSGVSRPWCDARVADNFMVADIDYRRLSEVTFWGSSDYYDYDDLTNFVAWNIVVYYDNDGLPGVVVYEEQIPIENIELTMTGDQHMNGGWEFRLTASLANPPTLYIDEPYWISIGAIAENPDGDYWIWSLNYFQGDDYSAVDEFDGAGYSSQDGDTAFELVAEPAGGCPRAGTHRRGCAADIDGSEDCAVTIADLAELLGTFGKCPGDPLYNPAANLADDGEPCITLADLAELLGQYGDDCGM